MEIYGYLTRLWSEVGDMRIHPRFNIPDFYGDLWLPDKIMVRGGGYEDSPQVQYPRLLQRFMAISQDYGQRWGI